MQQEMRWNLMGEPMRWEFDGEREVYHARYWLRVAAGDGGEYAIDCWGASSPEGGRREGERGLHLGKGAPEGGGPTAPG